MRYAVLLRYGLWRLHTVLKVNRSQDGEISCVEPLEPFAGMTWYTDGRFRVGADWESQRQPLAALSEPRVAYRIPGTRLLDERLPCYAHDLDDGATVQVSAHAVLEEPNRVELQLVLVPRGQEPYHRETVGDRRIEDGQPDIWVVLARSGDEPPDRVAVANRILRWPPPLRAQARP
jgi:hypothetical protein